MWGIDVSHHQGKINWKEVKDSGIQYVIMKAMMETSRTADNRFEYNYEQSGNQGLLRGVYLYMKSTNPSEARAEALDLLRILNYRRLEKGIWLDIEDSKIRNVGTKVLTDMVIASSNALRSAGYDVGIYSNLDWYLRVLEGPKLINDFQWWIARYPKDDDGTIKLRLKPDSIFTTWQYSSKGHVPGIGGDVDMDIDMSDLGKTNEQVAVEVCKGIWGNSEVRRNRISAAGYVYEDIQFIVNELLSKKNRFYPAYKGTSLKIDEVFRSIGVDDKYIGDKEKRFPIGRANGIINYKGTLLQNLKLISMAKQGDLMKPE